MENGNESTIVHYLQGEEATSQQFHKLQFPFQENKLIEVIHTLSCEPFKDIQQTQKLLTGGDPLPPFYLEKCEDGRYQLIPEIGDPERLLVEKDGKDRRTRITPTHEFPNSIHGHMIMKFGNGKSYVGSGVMVGPNHVLTAGHNICSHTFREGWASQVTFIPAQDEQKAPFGKVEGAVLLALKGWRDQRKPEFDLGMVVLGEPIGYRTGWGGLFCASDELLLLQNIRITGYPGDKGEGENRSTQMWTMNHKAKRLTLEGIEYTIDTIEGQSGSAIWTNLAGYPGFHVIGIHTHGGEINRGTRLSHQKIKTVLSWMDSYQMKNFLHPALPSVEQDAQKTTYEMYKERAANGEQEPRYELGNYFFNRRKFIKFVDAKDHLKFHSKKEGEVESRDFEKGVKMYEAAAMQGHVESMWSLARCFEVGRGVEMNLTNAIALHQKCASGNITYN